MKKNEKTVAELVAGITQEQYDAWVKKYGKGNVKRISVTTEDGSLAECYVHLPHLHQEARALYAKALKAYRADDVMTCGEIILNNCWLGGDERLKGTNPVIAMSAAMAAKNLLTFLSASILDE